jgi:hypothetical protein
VVSCCHIAPMPAALLLLLLLNGTLIIDGMCPAAVGCTYMSHRFLPSCASCSAVLTAAWSSCGIGCTAETMPAASASGPDHRFASRTVWWNAWIGIACLKSVSSGDGMSIPIATCQSPHATHAR